MSGPGALTVEHLRVALRKRAIVKDVSFSLPGGSLVALVGPNGAGKTTLLKAIAGLLPAEGDVRVEGQSIGAIPFRERARRLAYLPQGHSLHWPLPVRDIVALGRYPHGARDPARLTGPDAAVVEAAMHAAGVGDLARRNVQHLSGGERSRVALARVLAVGAPIILADEPTASLDPRYQIEVMGILHAVARTGTLVLVVTHDLGLAARFADSLLVLRDGALVVHGDPREALSDATLSDVFDITAFRAEHEGTPIVVPWTRA